MTIERLNGPARDICDLALPVALQLGYNFIHPEHLLLAMIRQEDSVLVQALGELGVEPSKLRHAVFDVLSQRLRDERSPRIDVRRG